MAISKIILNGVTQMDVTGKTVTAGDMLSGVTALKNDGTDITGNIASKTSADLTANNLTVTAPAGHYASAASKTLSDENLVAGNIKKNTTIFGVTGSYEGGGSSKNVQVVQGTTRTNSSTMTAIGAEMTVSKAGTYDVYWSAYRNNTSSGYTWQSQLYVGGAAYGTANTSFTNNQQNNHLSSVSLTANQKIRVYGSTTRGSSYYISAPTLVIVEA